MRTTRPELTGRLEESLPGEELTILTDSLEAMSTLFSLCQADFQLLLFYNTYRQLLTHVNNLLNCQFTAGVVTRFIKVKAHFGELLNEAADALASAAAEADDSPMADALHLDPGAVHFYIRDCPVGWGSQVRKNLNHPACLASGQATAALAVPNTRHNCTVKTPPITTGWLLLRQEQGRRVLG